MHFIFNVVFSAIGILIVYFLAKKWTGRKGKKFDLLFFKYFTIFFIIAVFISLIGIWIISEPKLITETVEQLKVDPKLKRSIGSYKGHGYSKYDIDKIKEMPTSFNLELFGTKAVVYLTVFVDSSDYIFEVKEYKIDSLKKE